MDEEKKHLLRVGLGVAAAMLVFAGLWFLLSDINTDTASRERVEDGFDETDREQREAASSIARVGEIARDSQDSAGRIADGIASSKNTVERVESADQRAATHVQDAATQSERIAGGLAGIAAGNAGAQEQIAEAERGNQSAAEAVERASASVSECQRLNHESQSILARYATGVSKE